jgi:hypothetical protein
VVDHSKRYGKIAPIGKGLVTLPGTATGVFYIEVSKECADLEAFDRLQVFGLKCCSQVGVGALQTDV